MKKNKKNNFVNNLLSIKRYVVMFRDFLVYKGLTDEFDKFVKERSKNYEKDIENFNSSVI